MTRGIYPNQYISTAAYPLYSNKTDESFTCSTNLCNDDEVNMDAKFVDDLNTVMERHQTSKLFTPFMAQLKSVQQRSRRSLKKRIDQNLKVRFGISISL